jgi:hypothetical protein
MGVTRQVRKDLKAERQQRKAADQRNREQLRSEGRDPSKYDDVV